MSFVQITKFDRLSEFPITLKFNPALLHNVWIMLTFLTIVVVVVVLFYVYGKHLRSCWDGQLT